MERTADVGLRTLLECDVVLWGDDGLLVVLVIRVDRTDTATIICVFSVQLTCYGNVVFCNDRTAIVDDGCISWNLQGTFALVLQCCTAVNVNGTACNRTVENQLRITLYENGGTCDIVTAHIEFSLAGDQICLASSHVFCRAPLSCSLRNSRNGNIIGRSKCSCLSCS